MQVCFSDTETKNQTISFKHLLHFNFDAIFFPFSDKMLLACFLFSFLLCSEAISANISLLLICLVSLYSLAPSSAGEARGFPMKYLFIRRKADQKRATTTDVCLLIRAFDIKHLTTTLRCHL